VAGFRGCCVFPNATVAASRGAPAERYAGDHFVVFLIPRQPGPLVGDMGQVFAKLDDEGGEGEVGGGESQDHHHVVPRRGIAEE